MSRRKCSIRVVSEMVLDFSVWGGFRQSCLPQGFVEGWGLEVVGRVDGWEALGKAVSVETEPRSQMFAKSAITGRERDGVGLSEGRKEERELIIPSRSQIN